ncbi:MAG: S8 family serine peptidase [Cytophagales bacterium]|nr:S8 family serine peptidase [Cytophagales bacterium]
MNLKLTRVKLLFLLTFFASFSVLAQTAQQRQAIINQSNGPNLKAIQNRLTQTMELEKQIATNFALQNNLPLRYTLPDGSGEAELMKIGPNGKLFYYVTDNVDAAVSTRTNFLNSGGGLGLNLDGQGMTAYVWDGGAVRATHQEFDGAGGNNRASQIDGATSQSSHATHVTGTIIASGFQAAAKGMATYAQSSNSDWNSDLAEMTTAAANGMLLSNHSYGFGWRNQFGQVQLPAYYGGAYIAESRDVDEIMYNAPFYLMVSSAGNDGDDNTANSSPLEGNSSFDKLNAYKTSKNNLVVAAANDVSVNPDGTINGVSITNFSSEGPTDDYRIKPDITGNGAGVYSAVASSNSAYSSYNGTSMSAPNVTGSLLLLQQHYNNLNGAFMRSSTLKALALHTADDGGITGPDAIYGWGLLNAKAAAETINENGTDAIIDELTLSQGGSYSITVNATGGPLLASICWTDPAGTINTGTINLSTPVLVNDLDIRVTQGGSTYFPYALTGVNSNAQQDNIVDPYERVDIANASGSYTITVTHKGNLSSGSQAFSLVVTGISAGPSCTLAAPGNLSASNVQDNSFNLSWNSVSGAANYTVTVGGNSTTVSGTSTSVTGLTAGTTYSTSVVANCSGGGSGDAANLSVTTTGSQPISCSSTVSSFPYSEGFESGDGWTQASGDDGDWYRDANGTPSNNTGPGSATEGSWYLFLEASTNGSAGQIGNNATAILESPCFDLSGETAATFSFANHMYGNNVGSLAVEASTDGTTWSSIWSNSGNQGNQWNAIDVSLNTYVGGTVKLRFVGTTGNGWSSDIAIDDLSVTTGGGGSGGACDPISFAGASLVTHTGSDDGVYSFPDNNTVLLEDNTWRSLLMSYDITSSTVIDFEFRSTSQGEIHGVAFGSDANANSSLTFKVHGTQNWGITDYDNYSGSSWTNYSIPVGTFYTGLSDRLVFVNDNDAGSGNNSYFRNIVIHEGTCPNSNANLFTTTGEESLGTDDVDATALIVYPVPASTELNISTQLDGESAYTVISITGQKVMQGLIERTQSKLDISRLEPGTYLLRITDGDNNYVSRFMKQ